MKETRISWLPSRLGAAALALLYLATGGLVVVAQPGDVELSDAAARLLEERDARDSTIWKPEVDAQAYERVFSSMWDQLLKTDHDLEAIRVVPFRRIALPLPRDVRQLEWGIRETSYEAGEAFLNREQFARWLDELLAAGYRLHESEWHHSEFQPEDDAQPPRSLVSFLLHVSGPDQRLAIEGKLRVRWTSDSTPAAPRIDSLQVVDAVLRSRNGGIAFEPLDVHPSDQRRPPRAQPLIVYDLDRDGHCEIILGESNIVYRNQGQGRFKAERFLRYPVGTLVNGLIVDLDRDGRLEYVSVGGDFFLQRVEADEAGLFSGHGERICNTKFTRPQAFSAGDVDGDGDLDLWCGQYMPPYVYGQMPTPYYDANDGLPDYLLINNGQGQFTDGTDQAGLTAKANRRTYGGSLVDLNDDGHLDLVVISDFSGVDVYHNDGAGRFVDVTDQVVPQRHTFGMGYTLADYDNNQKLDLYVIGMSSTTAKRLSKLGLGIAGHDQIQAMRNVMGYGNRMYLDQGRGTYRIPEFNDQVARTGWSWGCSSFDFDNDGDRDIYVANGHRSGDSCQDYCTTFWTHDIYLEPEGLDKDVQQLLRITTKDMHSGHISWNGYEHNKLLMNREGRGFVNVAWPLGVAFETDSRAVVTEDLDSDGRADLLVTEYKTRGRQEAFQLNVLRNTLATENHWVGVRLNDSAEGGSTVGATVTLEAGDRAFVHRVVTGDSFTAQHAPGALFGIGTLEAVQSLTVRWADGRAVTLTNPEVDRYHVLSTAVGE